MPEHSGTGTLADFFHDQLRVDTCGAAKNKHAPRVHEPAVAGGCDDDVHFVLAANPFRRVISAAAMRQKITGGRRLRLAKSKKFDRDTDIRAFRAWVRTLREPPVRLAADLVQSVKNLTYVVDRAGTEVGPRRRRGDVDGSWAEASQLCAPRTIHVGGFFGSSTD